MRFRTTLLLGILALLMAMSATVVAGVKIVLDRSAQRDVSEQLRRTQEVFVELNRYRHSQLSAGARMLADTPRLMALMATVDITPITVQGVAEDLSQAIGTERFLIADHTGAILVDLGATSRENEPGSDPGNEPRNEPEQADRQSDRIIARALETGSASGMWIHGRGLYQVLAQRVVHADETLGVVVIGYRFDERMTQTVFRLTGSEILIELDGQMMTSISLLAGGFAMVPRSGAATVPTDASAPVELTLHGTKYLARAARFEGAADSGRLRYVILRSLDRALAPGRKLQRVAYVCVGIGAPLAFLLAILVAGRLSRPVDSLVRVTEQIGAGDLTARAPVVGAVEMRSLASAVNRMAASLDESRAELARKHRVEQEMAIAARIQTAILPPAPLSAPGLDIAAAMLPATEVGGDYYDVLLPEKTADDTDDTGDTDDRRSCWLAIGDVAGHGVPAGMIMMMVQNVIASMTRARPELTPSDIFCRVNRVLVDHVRRRMQRDDHVTLTLLHHDGDGAVTFAGAHEDILVWRAGSRTCETIETPGTWLAVMDEIDEFITDQVLNLDAGDTMVLYTDGITEAKNGDGEQFGMDRLRAAIAEHADESVESLCAAIVDEVTAWMHAQDDDITIMAVRYTPSG